MDTASQTLPSRAEPKCSRCNDSGTIAVSVYYPMNYRAPGPVPDDARGVIERACDECAPPSPLGELLDMLERAENRSEGSVTVSCKKLRAAIAEIEDQVEA